MSAEVRAETGLNNLTLAPSLQEIPERIEPAEEQSSHILEKIRETRLGRAIAVGGAALAMAGAGEAVNSERADASAAQPHGSKVKVVTLKAKSVGFANKFAKCLAKAEKEEQPAPPVDPYAKCKGVVKVRVNAKAVAECKPGYLGGRAAARASVTQRIRVSAWSRAIASGRAKAKAAYKIRDRVKTKATANVNCVKLKDQKIPLPPPPEKPPIPPEQPPVPPPPPPKKENRPPTTEMTPPEHVFENGQVRICTQNFDPDGDNLDTDFDALRGTTSFEFPHPTAPNVVCTNYTAPSTEGTDTVTVNVTDGQASDSDSETFPIVDDNF